MNEAIQFFVDCGIASSASRPAQIIAQAAPDLSYRAFNRGDEYATYLWECTTRTNNLAGQSAGLTLELIVAATMARAQAGPFLRSVESELVPTHRIDFWFETISETPVIISCNAKLKERWRNENLAAYALKLTLGAARWYVITADEDEATACSARISSGTASYLDGCFTFRSEQFQRLVQELSRTQLRVPSRTLKYHSMVRTPG